MKINTQIIDRACGAAALETVNVGTGSSIDINQFIDKNLYGITIDPSTDNILGFDAGDYTSAGTMYRYDANGLLIDSYEVGVVPNSAGL